MTKSVYYHNPRCSKSRQGLALLEEHNFPFTIKEYLKEGLDQKELTSIVKKLESDLHTLVRSKESEFKETGLKLKELSRDDIIELLIKYPKLLERPLLVTSKQAVIGRPPEALLVVIS